MTIDSHPDGPSLPVGLQFAVRKVRMAREFYIEATAPGHAKYRIGSFKIRGRAQDWIKAHAAHWRPDQAGPNTRERPPHSAVATIVS
jgi:hypothetical protein